jgi:2,3,4,5-tetrahydropyridine-2-carboxylate N-succinyltransferase
MSEYDIYKPVNEKAFEGQENITPKTKGEVREAILEVIKQLNAGRIRVAEKINGKWVTNEWIKKAILLYIKIKESVIFKGAPNQPLRSNAYWFDKIPQKFAGWDADKFIKYGIRAVPNCMVRYGSFIAPKTVLMPSFVNIGAYIDEGCMVDTWATVGSCAQVGKNVHISGGAGIGGVLEPAQAAPVIIEDNVFIGARSEIVEGVIVEEGAVISMGVFIGKSTKIIDRETGEVFYGRVPAYSVVVPGTYPSSVATSDGSPAPNLYCAVIVKKVDAKTRAKVKLTDLLREN